MIRAFGLPGYVLLFTGWMLLIGLIATGFYIFIYGSAESAEPVSSEPAFSAAQAGLLEWFLMIVILIISWSGIAYFTGRVLKWLIKRLKIPDRFNTPMKIGLLCLGWLVLVTASALIFPEFDYIMLIAGGIVIGIGSVSFGIEAWLFKVFRLSTDVGW